MISGPTPAGSPIVIADDRRWSLTRVSRHRASVPSSPNEPDFVTNRAPSGAARDDAGLELAEHLSRSMPIASAAPAPCRPDEDERAIVALDSAERAGEPCAAATSSGPSPRGIETSRSPAPSFRARSASCACRCASAVRLPTTVRIGRSRGGSGAAGAGSTDEASATASPAEPTHSVGPCSAAASPQLLVGLGLHDEQPFPGERAGVVPALEVDGLEAVRGQRRHGRPRRVAGEAAAARGEGGCEDDARPAVKERRQVGGEAATQQAVDLEERDVGAAEMARDRIDAGESGGAAVRVERLHRPGPDRSSRAASRTRRQSQPRPAKTAAVSAAPVRSSAAIAIDLEATTLRRVVSWSTIRPTYPPGCSYRAERRSGPIRTMTARGQSNG